MMTHVYSRLACVLLALLLMTPPALADAVKVAGFWVENVQIRSVDNGTLLFISPTGQPISQPLLTGDGRQNVEAIRVATVPEIEQAQNAEDVEAKIAALRAALKKADRPWLRQYVQRELVAALAASTNPLEAVRVYVDAVTGTGADEGGGAAMAFSPEPPVLAVAAATDAAKGTIRDLLTPALEKAPEAARADMRALLSAAAAGGQGAEPAPGQASGAVTAGAGLAAGQPAVVLPAFIQDNDPIGNLLRQGRFDEALEASDGAIRSSEGSLSTKLYLRGMAQLARADRTGEQEDYLNAGLSFMRVVIHFPRSQVVGPAMVEAGYVHQKIGRPDQAGELFDGAEGELDAETDAAYLQRLETLRNS